MKSFHVLLSLSVSAEEAEFRLVSLMPDYTDQPDVQYMQKTESSRPSKSPCASFSACCPGGTLWKRFLTKYFVNEI